MTLKIAAFVLVLLSSAAVHANNDMTEASQRAALGKGWIKITNKTNTDLAYRVSGAFEGWVYGIKKGETDTYALKGTDDHFSRFEVGVCKRMGPTGGACAVFETLHTCLPKGYHFMQYNYIDVNNLNTCVLTDSYDW